MTQTSSIHSMPWPWPPGSNMRRIARHHRHNPRMLGSTSCFPPPNLACCRRCQDVCHAGSPFPSPKHANLPTSTITTYGSQPISGKKIPTLVNDSFSFSEFRTPRSATNLVLVGVNLEHGRWGKDPEFPDVLKVTVMIWYQSLQFLKDKKLSQLLSHSGTRTSLYSIHPLLYGQACSTDV